MAKTKYAPIVMPLVEIIERQQAVINALVSRVNELSDAVLGDHVPVTLDGIGIEGNIACRQVKLSDDVNLKYGNDSSNTDKPDGGTGMADDDNLPDEVTKSMMAQDIFLNDDGEYYFDDDTLSPNFGRYILALGSKSGTFSLSGDANAKFNFVTNPATFVDPVAEYDATEPIDTDCDVKTISPGRLKLVGYQWVITEKAKVKFVKNI